MPGLKQVKAGSISVPVFKYTRAQYAGLPKKQACPRVFYFKDVRAGKAVLYMCAQIPSETRSVCLGDEALG